MKLLLVLLGFVALTGCTGRKRVVLSDVTATNSIVIKSGEDSFSGLTLHVYGQLKGTAYLHAANWDTQVLSGTINWSVYHDWYQTNCLLYYRPEGVRSGNLTIEYEFH